MRYKDFINHDPGGDTTQDLTCYDAYGSLISNFYQWDSGLKIFFENIFPELPVVHFCNKTIEKTLCVPSSYTDDGRIQVDVPNVLLLDPYPMSVYVFLIHDGEERTVLYKKIPVRERKQPEDFLFSENLEVIHLSELQKDVLELNALVTEAEKVRAANESTRADAETQRVANEEIRQETLNDCMEALDNIAALVERADAAIQACDTATGEAQNVVEASKLEELNGKYTAVIDYLSDPVTQDDIDLLLIQQE